MKIDMKTNYRFTNNNTNTTTYKDIKFKHGQFFRFTKDIQNNVDALYLVIKRTSPFVVEVKSGTVATFGEMDQSIQNEPVILVSLNI